MSEAAPNPAPALSPSRFLPPLAAVAALLAAEAQQVTPVRPPGGGDPHFALPVDEFVDDRGNRIPDFSHAGYMANAAAIPNLPVRLVVPPADGDDTRRIQAALDRVAGLEPDEHGHRGAVLLEAATYQVAGQLVLRRGGVVLRGQGPGEDGTTLEATGPGRRVLIRVLGKADREWLGEPVAVSGYVPVGATGLTLDAPLAPDASRVVLTRPSTEAWIRAAGMERSWNAPDAPRAWREGELDLYWDRAVVSRSGSSLELDAPVTMTLDPRWGGATVRPYHWPGRVEQAGVENLRLISVAGADRPLDEDHSWVGVSVENARDCWVRRLTLVGFAGSAVSLWESASRITVSDCRSLAPVSELGGWRRHTFFTQGQQTLFLRCESEQGRHDFSTGHTAAGPNAFVHCDAREALEDSGPIGPWATGVLFDNVNIDGNGLRLRNRGSQLKFAGWTAAYCLLWQCTAAEIDCYAPPTAQNWAFGCWGIFEGDGLWREFNEFVSPKSLMQAQVAARLGDEAGERIGPGIVHPPGSTRPSVEQARSMAARSNRPAPQLHELIARHLADHPLPTDPAGAEVLNDSMLPPLPPTPKPQRLALVNGWLTLDGKLAVGTRAGGDPWWRGTIAPTRVAAGSERSAEPAVTRFVPGRSGLGYTDDLEVLADSLVASGAVAREHHPPLWYDRRRDDHQRVRRIDGEVWPPFYEMPYARSGEGTAWDGLSRYDLTQPNRFYFDRLDRLAGLFEERGLILLARHYMQHNILEAGGHWADYPWRSANNVNHTGFPEPPPYAGDKRIFQAHLFYDVDHPLRGPLHRRTVAMFLDELHDRPNVIHLLGEEYTGPLAFTRHWVESAAEWERTHDREVLIGLSTTKPEQDAILADPRLAPAIDLIDIRYWGLVAGLHLAPRQQGRAGVSRPEDRSGLSRVRDYRLAHPGKAVIRSQGGGPDGWALVMEGGSLPRALPGADEALLRAIPRMRPCELASGEGDPGCLAEPGVQYLVHSPTGPFELDLSGVDGEFEGRWVGTGAEAVPARGGGSARFTPPGVDGGLLWLRRTDS